MYEINSIENDLGQAITVQVIDQQGLYTQDTAAQVARIDFPHLLESRCSGPLQHGKGIDFNAGRFRDLTLLHSCFLGHSEDSVHDSLFLSVFGEEMHGEVDFGSCFPVGVLDLE